MVETKNPIADKSNYGVTTNQPKNYLYCTLLELLVLVPVLLLLFEAVFPELLRTVVLVLRLTVLLGALLLLVTDLLVLFLA